MQYERKIIQIFKSFIEKALVPQIKRMQGSLFEWNKFNALISQQTINYTELQMYVDSLGPMPTSPISFEKKDIIPKFAKKREDDQLSPSMGFNPSKTFGGDRARMMFPLKTGQEDNGKEWSFNSVANKNKDDFYNKSQNNGNSNPQSFLPGLERLTKIFGESHSKIEGMIEVLSIGSANGPFTTEFRANN